MSRVYVTCFASNVSERMATNASARPDSARIELGVQTRNANAILAIVLDENR